MSGEWLLYKGVVLVSLSGSSSVNAHEELLSSLISANFNWKSNKQEQSAGFPTDCGYNSFVLLGHHSSTRHIF